MAPCCLHPLPLAVTRWMRVDAVGIHFGHCVEVVR